MSETANEHIQEQGVENLTPEAYELISGLVRADDRAALLKELESRHESDIAEIITVLASDLRTAFLKLVGDALDPEVFAELDDAVRDDVLQIVDTDTLVNTVQQLDLSQAHQMPIVCRRNHQLPEVIGAAITPCHTHGKLSLY